MSDASDGPGGAVDLPRTERTEAPRYLATYHERRAGRPLDAERGEVDDTPLYLRRFRQRAVLSPTPATSPVWEGRDLGFQQALSESNRNKEISAPPQARKPLVTDIYLVRHAETQGYSSESGLTPLGTWQAHTKGHNLSKRLAPGETVVIVSAATSRARETAASLHRGLLDGIAMFDKDVKVHEPRELDAFSNFRVATPSGFRDVTAAFREYYAVLEEYERVALGDRPMWLVEIDRFWRTQEAGEDPIRHWLSVPMLHFEPPASTVRRFWRGIERLSAEYPRARLVIATHSGPIRAFAVWALGYDPGEPYNVEHVRVKLREGGTEAFVSYRNRVQEVHVPPVDELPRWEPEPVGEGAS